MERANLHQVRVQIQTYRAMKQIPVLSNLDFSGLPMQQFDLQGVQCRECCFDGADLQSGYLAGVDLKGCSLIGTLLDGADIKYSDLTDANMQECKADLACLRGAILVRTNLTKAELFGINAIESVWVGVEVEGANLTTADFTQATIADVDFSKVFRMDYAMLINVQISLPLFQFLETKPFTEIVFHPYNLLDEDKIKELYQLIPSWKR